MQFRWKHALTLAAAHVARNEGHRYHLRLELSSLLQIVTLLLLPGPPLTLPLLIASFYLLPHVLCVATPA